MHKFAYAFLLFTSPAFAQAPLVLTDIPAVHSLVSQVMQGVASPQILLDQGNDPHSFQMRPSQARALSQADVLFFIGPELTPWLERAIYGVGIKGEAIELLEVEGTILREFEKHDEEHAAHETDDDGHHHDGIDPHAWLMPLNSTIWLDHIADKLAHLDPENALTYHQNANTAKAHVEQLDAEISILLAPIKDMPIIVFHDAYGYFADHYGLTIAGTVKQGDAATPGAAHLVELRQIISQSDVFCAFGEDQHDPALLHTLFGDSNVSIGVLDPFGSSLEYGPELYALLLHNMAYKIADCRN